MEVMVPEILDIVWAYNAHDTAHAVRGACFRLLHDRGNGHSRFAGLLRAEALQILGEEFWPKDRSRRTTEPQATAVLWSRLLFLQQKRSQAEKSKALLS